MRGGWQQGFALATTLWLLAILTVAVGYLTFWAEETVNNAWRLRERFQAEVEVRSTEAALLYLLASRRITLAGLSLRTGPAVAVAEDSEDMGFNRLLPLGDELLLDDRWYEGLGETRFAIQDESGLIPLREASVPALARLLGLLEVPDAAREPLLAKLFDYTDPDDLYRLNGAEAAQYRDRGLSSPPNRDLLSSWELRAVLDWNRQTVAWREQRLPRLTTTRRGGLPNLNTAPVLALQTLSGIDHETARRLVAGRPYVSLLQANLAAGRELPGDEMSFPLLPSSYLRLSIAHPALRTLHEVHVQLTPFATQSPWLIDYVAEIPWERIPTPAALPESVVFAPPLPAAAR